MAQMLNSDVSDHRLNVKAIIKNINTISLELKKMKDMHQRQLSAAAAAKGKGTAKTSVDPSELTAEAEEERTTTPGGTVPPRREHSQLLLCDLTLHFNHPVKTDDSKETERNKPLFEEFKLSDVSLTSNRFSS